MESPKPPAATPVAFWRAMGKLWIEFADGHSQGFHAVPSEFPNRTGPERVEHHLSRKRPEPR